MLLRSLSLAALHLALVPGAVAAQDTAPPAEPPARATAGMVSSAHPLATRVGLEILEAGGNAFDATVAVAAALNVVEPMMSGMGGYGTILVYSAQDDTTLFLNPSGRIPRGVRPDDYREPTPGYLENRRGAKAVSTPGNVNAWAAMHERFGSMEWSRLFTPAIRLARDGFVLDERIARGVAFAYDEFPDHARGIYGREGEPLGPGDRLVQADLGRSLELIAREGPDAFYRGELGEAIDRTMREADGFLRLEDLQENEAEWWAPIGIDYRGHRVVTASPPANSFPALVRLGLMSRFDVGAMGHNSVEYLHAFAEATKHAFWTRLAYAGDPEVDPPPLDTLLAESYWEEVAREMPRDRATDFVPPAPRAPWEMQHTTHFVVADRSGNVVSATQTLGNAFGARIMPEGTGIWLNNSLAYSTFEPAGNPMDAHPGRRKLSGDVPLFVLDEESRPWLAVGTPGGHTIAQTVPQVVMNVLDFGMDIQQAIAEPRISFVEPNQLRVEDRIPEAVRDELARRGHDLRVGGGIGNAHGLTVERGPDGLPTAFTGGADPRGAGLAEGLEALSAQSARSAPTVSLDFEAYELDNGLDVVLHVDRSDPVAAVAMTFQVGSAKEVPGRTGFAHMFEHLFFLDSENLGPGGLDRLMTRIGSSTNGSTSRDRTNYFEVVPVDGLEKALWAEADKLGFFINTVTESTVAKERQVVKNEKRQGVDNNPYGHASYVIDRALYPGGHPYSWQVIGSLADLDAATLEDVKAFHRDWYGPNNATLVVAGDIDVERTKAWIERYFGEIPARPTPPDPDPEPATLEADVRLFHEDNFARVPQLQLAWHGVPRFHEDSYALDALARLLTDGKNAPLYEVLVEEEGLAPSVSAFNSTQELAGRFTLTVRAYDDTDLDDVLAAVERGMRRFSERGVPPDELARVKAGTETSFYGSLSSVLGKAFRLADYHMFAGDAGYMARDLERTLGVTAEDVMRVYRRYLADRPRVEVSFVPMGRAELALTGSERAEVVEEEIVQGAEEAFEVVRGEARTPSSFDRSVEPPFGDPPTLRAPAVWGDTLANGLAVLGVEDREIPLVQFELRMRGGLLVEDPDRVGVANLLAETMTEGTARRTPAELEQAIDMLGASISVSAGDQTFTLRGSTLARNFRETMALVEEILLEPRFDSTEFELARQRALNALSQRSASPTAVAGTVFGHLVYGDHILARDRIGTPGSVGAITLEDLRAFHRRTLVPSVAAFHVAGAVERTDVLAALDGLRTRWSGEAPSFPAPPAWDPDRAGLYFVDIPDAKQSVLSIGYLALPETHPDHWSASVMNFRLGGGGFASDLTQVLREQKGYTYGIRSGFSGTALPGPFQITSSVRTNVTLEALDLIKSILEAHGPEFDEADLEATKSFLLRANARAFETLGAKLGLLGDMSAYGFPADYVLQREAVVRDMTIERVRKLADRYLDPAGMVWLVVGDARTQAGRLAPLGLGDAAMLDREGEPAPGGGGG